MSNRKNLRVPREGKNHLTFFADSACQDQGERGSVVDETEVPMEHVSVYDF